jgi:hypothetical protein
MSFFNDFTKVVELEFCYYCFLLRIIISSLVRRFARVTHIIEHRTNLVVKYYLLTNILALIAVILIWGVQAKDIIIAISSITTVVGVCSLNGLY